MDFTYQAVNAHGQTQSGSITAASEREALGQLRQQNLTPIELVQDVAATSAESVGFSFRRTKVSAEDKSLAIRELGTLLTAGVPLAEAVDSMARSRPNQSLGLAFGKMHNTLRGGSQLTVALRNSGIAWPDYLYQLTTAAEQTGKIPGALIGAADQMEYEERIRNEMRNALIYPSVLVVSGISATLLIFLVVVPKFASMLKSSKAKLPDISVWVLKTGLFVKENITLFAIGAAVLVLMIMLAARKESIRRAVMEWLARVPIIGTWLLETEIGRWSAMLAVLLSNRVPLLSAMDLAEQSLRLSSLRQRMHHASREIRSGKKIADALAGARVLNITGLNLIRVGERSGELPDMLRTLAKLYENAGRQRLQRFLVLLEPAAILLIGGVIGFIMVAIMLAITSMSNFTI